MKNIINTILNEKHIMEIESEKLVKDQCVNSENKEGQFKIKNIPHSIKRLKEKIDMFHSLEDLKRELHLVINSFRNKDYISDEVYSEHKIFIDHLIIEGKKFLKERKEKEEASKKEFKFSFSDLKKIKTH